MWACACVGGDMDKENNNKVAGMLWIPSIVLPNSLILKLFQNRRVIKGAMFHSINSFIFFAGTPSNRIFKQYFSVSVTMAKLLFICGNFKEF